MFITLLRYNLHSVSRLDWHLFVWIVTLYLDVDNVESEAHSAADLRLSQCKLVPGWGLLTGFTELTGLSALCCFLFHVKYSTGHTSASLWVSQHECLRPVSLYCFESLPVDLVRLGHLDVIGTRAQIRVTHRLSGVNGVRVCVWV